MSKKIYVIYVIVGATITGLVVLKNYNTQKKEKVEIKSDILLKAAKKMSTKERTLKTCQNSECWRVVTDRKKFKAQNRIWPANDNICDIGEWTDLHPKLWDTKEQAQEVIHRTRKEVLKQMLLEWVEVESNIKTGE